MAKSRGLDELLVGMVAVGAVLPDSAAFLYEPTFLLQGVKLAGREMTSLDEKVVFRVGDLSVGQFLAKEVMQHLKDCGQFENRSSSSGVVDYTLDDLAYGTAAVIAKLVAASNQRAYEQVYQSFVVQYSLPGSRGKYKAVKDVGLVTEAMYVRMKSAGQPSCAADWAELDELDDATLQMVRGKLAEATLDTTVDKLTAAGGTLWGALPRSGMASISDQDFLNELARAQTRSGGRTALR